MKKFEIIPIEELKLSDFVLAPKSEAFVKLKAKLKAELTEEELKECLLG